jgi:hypothetical protein
VKESCQEGVHETYDKSDPAPPTHDSTNINIHTLQEEIAEFQPPNNIDRILSHISPVLITHEMKTEAQ